MNAEVSGERRERDLAIGVVDDAPLGQALDVVSALANGTTSRAVQVLVAQPFNLRYGNGQAFRSIVGKREVE